MSLQLLPETMVDASLLGPSGTFQVVSATVNRRPGTSPDTTTVSIRSDSRLRGLEEFIGSKVPFAQSPFTRGALPKPGGGVSLSSGPWHLTCTDPKGGSLDVGPLFLVGASVVKYSVAEGPLGPIIQDRGSDRQEIIELRFADARIFWNVAGYVAGGRNILDPLGSSAVSASSDPLKIRLQAQKLKFGKNGSSPKTIDAEPPAQVELNIPAVGGKFSPETMANTKGTEGTLFSLQNLIQEILDRLPYVKPTKQGEAFGELRKIFPVDVDYAEGRSAAEAFGLLGSRFGLLFGIQLDGSFFVGFDAIPSTEFSPGSLLSRQEDWEREDRGGSTSPAPPAIRFYPSTVIKEVLWPRFVPVVKTTDGNIEGLYDFAKRVEVPSNLLEEIGFGMMSRDEIDQAVIISNSEKSANGGPENRFKTTTRQETDNHRIIADHAFKTFKFELPEEVRQTVSKIAQRERDKIRKEFLETTHSLKSLPLAQDRDSVVKKEEDIGFHYLAMLDSIFSIPADVVTRVEGVGDLKPRFIGDICFRRIYTAFDLAQSIIREASTVEWARAGGNPYRFSNKDFQQIIDGLVEKLNFLKFENRRPVDWQSATDQASTLQRDWIDNLGSLDGTSITVAGFKKLWSGSSFEVATSGEPVRGVFEVFGPCRPIQTMVEWVSTDVSEHLASFDEKTGVAHFDTPLGLFGGSRVTQNILRFSREQFIKSLDRDFRQLAKDHSRAADPSSFRSREARIAEALAYKALLVKKIGLILAEDSENSVKIIDISLRPVLQRMFDNPGDFKGILEDHLKRSPFKPLWILSSIQPFVEVKSNEPKVDGTPDGKKESPEHLAGRARLKLGALDAEPAQKQDPSAPSLKTIQQVPPRVDAGVIFSEGRGPSIINTPVMARLWIRVPFDEAAWPHMDFGDQGPFQIERLKTPWVETMEFEPLTLAQFKAEANRRFSELTNQSTLEESQDIVCGGLFSDPIGPIIRNYSASFGPGGSQPRVRVSCSILPTRADPLARAFSQVQSLLNKQSEKIVKEFLQYRGFRISKEITG